VALGQVVEGAVGTAESRHPIAAFERGFRPFPAEALRRAGDTWSLTTMSSAPNGQ
jgi:hypothetical protein